MRAECAEQIYRKSGYGKKSDIFGVGIVGYIMLSSWSPWSSSDPKQLMIETMTQEVKYYPSHWGGVSDLGKLLHSSPLFFHLLIIRLASH